MAYTQGLIKLFAILFTGLKCLSRVNISVNNSVILSKLLILQAINRNNIYSTYF